MIDFINAMRRELSGLEAELLADPRYIKMRHLRELLAIYEPSPPVERKAERKTSPAFAPKPTAGAKTKAAAMLQVITDLLRSGVQVHRSKILEDLQNRGIMGSEKNPMANLAAFLSDHRDRFESDGKGRFRLRGNGIAPAGLFENDTDRSLAGPAGDQIGA